MSETTTTRHAVVTGGARGIGYAIAETLLHQGHSITLMGRSETPLKKACQQLQSLGSVGYVTGDISQREAVEQAFQQAVQARGTISILVNNAGQATSERFDRLTEADWHQMIAVNLTGTYHCIQVALAGMFEQQWGRIINVASTAGLVGYSYVAAYCAAKHGVIGLTRSLALECAKKGVTVNAVCPGYTETELIHEAIDNIIKKTGMSEDDARAQLAKNNPQGKLVQPQQVAEVVGWLCQPGADAVNGQSIPVDGGEVMVG